MNLFYSSSSFFIFLVGIYFTHGGKIIYDVNGFEIKGKVQAFAKVVWPDTATDCIKLLKREYDFDIDNTVAGNYIGYPVDNLEELKILLHKLAKHKSSYDFYVIKRYQGFGVMKAPLTATEYKCSHLVDIDDLNIIAPVRELEVVTPPHMGYVMNASVHDVAVNTDESVKYPWVLRKETTKDDRKLYTPAPTITQNIVKDTQSISEFGEIKLTNRPEIKVTAHPEIITSYSEIITTKRPEIKTTLPEIITAHSEIITTKRPEIKTTVPEIITTIRPPIINPIAVEYEAPSEYVQESVIYEKPDSKSIERTQSDYTDYEYVSSIPIVSALHDETTDDIILVAQNKVTPVPDDQGIIREITHLPLPVSTECGSDSEGSVSQGCPDDHEEAVVSSIEREEAGQRICLDVPKDRYFRKIFERFLRESQKYLKVIQQ